MANFKVVISDPSSKKAYQKEIDQGQSGLLGKKVGEKAQGSSLGLAGYEVEVTGGSDKDGFPMRPDVDGPGRKKVILTSPPGYHPAKFGKRKRKSVRGNTISMDISQVNVKVVKAGSKKLEELIGAKAKKEDGKEKPAEEKKEEAKPAEKPDAEAKAGEGKDAGKADVKPSEEKPDATKAEGKMGIKKLEDKEKEEAKSEQKKEEKK